MVIDGHTHFLRDDTRLMAFVKGREAVGQWGWNKALAGKDQTIDDLKYANYIKEICDTQAPPLRVRASTVGGGGEPVLSGQGEDE